MYKIRKSVFETNSSSVHSLTFVPTHEDSEFFVDANGDITLVLNQYWGKHHRDYFSQEDKLKYIASWLYCYLGEDYEKFVEEYDWINIEEAVIKYVNAHPNRKQIGITAKNIRVVITDKCGFDHQTYPDWCSNCACVVDTWNPDAVINFVFNHNIGLRTESD